MAILDQYGRTVCSRGLFPSPSHRPGENRPRPTLRPKTYENVTSYQREELVTYSRVIRAGIPNIDAALEMKANFAFGDSWHVTYKGTNKQWGRRMEAHINDEFYRDCNILGDAHDFHTTLKEFSFAM